MLLIHRNLRKSLVNLHLPKFWEAMMDFFQSEVTGQVRMSSGEKIQTWRTPVS